YLLPGIIGEVGELIGEFGKAHWHGADRTAEITAEYGDVAWLTAVLLHRDRVTDLSHVTNLRYTESADAALELLLARAVSVYRSGDSTRAARAAGLWVALADHAEIVTGQPWAAVLQGNLDKLAARAAAGQLRTHG